MRTRPLVESGAFCAEFWVFGSRGRGGVNLSERARRRPLVARHASFRKMENPGSRHASAGGQLRGQARLGMDHVNVKWFEKVDCRPKRAERDPRKGQTGKGPAADWAALAKSIVCRVVQPSTFKRPLPH